MSEFITNLTDLVDEISNGREPFGCIYADPPWQYNNQGTRGAAKNHYSTMSIDEIVSLPVSKLAADKSHLHLWTTNAFLFECPKLFDAWGFEYKSTFVWVKPQIGLGNYWRNSHELLLMGVRGGLVAQKKNIQSWILSHRGEHSSKPRVIQDRIMELSPGPYLELFGRHAYDDWTVWGNQRIPYTDRLFK